MFTHQWIADWFSCLRVRSIVEFGRARHHGQLKSVTIFIHHPKELVDKTRELRVGIQLLLEGHSNALKGDIVMGGPDSPRGDEMCVLCRKKGHLFGDDLLYIWYDRYSLHGHAELSQCSRQESTVGVHRVPLENVGEQS